MGNISFINSLTLPSFARLLLYCIYHNFVEGLIFPHLILQYNTV